MDPFHSQSRGGESRKREGHTQTRSLTHPRRLTQSRFFCLCKPRYQESGTAGRVTVAAQPSSRPLPATYHMPRPHTKACIDVDSDDSTSRHIHIHSCIHPMPLIFHYPLSISWARAKPFQFLPGGLPASLFFPLPLPLYGVKLILYNASHGFASSFHPLLKPKLKQRKKTPGSKKDADAQAELSDTAHDQSRSTW